jgi:hypothetical protein
MRHLLISPATLGTFTVGLALSLAATAAMGEQPLHPCEQIIHVCKHAGFVEGDYKKGYGLWIDCIDPIMRGTKQPAIADKPLPPVSPELIEACKQKDPNFGERNKGAPKAK